MHRVDAVDARLLLARDRSPDASLIDTAAQLGISRNTVRARLKKLRDTAALRPPSSAVTPAALDRHLLAFMTRSIPEVIEAHTTTGDADILLRVIARDTVDLHRVTQSIQSAPGVQRSSTSIATTEVIPQRMSLLLHRLATGEM
jgi:DNA-binding Lrp family transcriptional regulator